MHNQEFILALVHLLYSVSKSDQEVHLLEVQKILDIINEDIPKIFPEIPKTDQLVNRKLAIKEFKRLYNNEATEEAAYSAFLRYYRKHRTEFNLDINLLCYRLAGKVAYSHKGVNVEEKQLLLKLKRDLEVD